MVAAQSRYKVGPLPNQDSISIIISAMVFGVFSPCLLLLSGEYLYYPTSTLGLTPSWALILAFWLTIHD